MQWQLLFFSMAPIAAFMTVRASGGLRPALVVAIAVAVIEFGYNSYHLGGIEHFSLVSLLLFGAFGAVAAGFRRFGLRGFLAAPPKDSSSSHCPMDNAQMHQTSGAALQPVANLPESLTS